MLKVRRHPSEIQYLDHYHPMALLPPPDMQPFLPYIPVILQASIRGHCPLKPLPLIGHALSHPSSFHLAQASFDSNFYLHKYPAVSSQLFFLFTPPLKMEQTGCSAMSPHNKFRHWGIAEKKEYNKSVFVCLWCSLNVEIG